jgi:hypothetical protein
MIIGVIQGSDDPFKRERLLRQIGVDEQILQTALDAGDSAALRCTANHPKMMPGMYRFGETVASLGAQLWGQGWTREDYKGFATVLSPDGLIAIAVASGDDGTGDIHADVTTRSPKGIATIEAVSGNLSLPLDDRYVADNERIAIRVDAAATDNSTTTYFLLHDRRGGIRYAELSRPMSINKKGYAETWEPRIPITAKPLDPVVVKVDGDPPINPIVPVKRRDSI